MLCCIEDYQNMNLKDMYVLIFNDKLYSTTSLQRQSHCLFFLSPPSKKRSITLAFLKHNNKYMCVFLVSFSLLSSVEFNVHISFIIGTVFSTTLHYQQINLAICKHNQEKDAVLKPWHFYNGVSALSVLLSLCTA